MDKNISAPELDELLKTIHELREITLRNERCLEKILQHLKLMESGSEQSDYWLPSEPARDIIKPVHTLSKIRTAHINSDDVVTRLRDSWLGNFYRRNLKHIPLIRWLTAWVWRKGYPIYINHISSEKAKYWRSIVTLSEFVSQMHTPKYILADENFVETPRPEVFPHSDQCYLISPHDRYVFPEIFVTTLSDALIYGGTNLIVVNENIVCHDLYDFKRDYTSEELHGRTLIDPKAKRIRWLLNDEAPERIEMAAIFVDACAPNYAHWITEVLPRIVLFCKDQRFKGVPLVVNEGLHKNIMESLFLVAESEREIIALPIGTALSVNTLFVTSPAGYVPFERRNKKLSNHSHGLFSLSAFEQLRLELLAAVDMMSVDGYPQNIFLRRRSGARNVTNGDEIERLLIAQGFTIVEPERLSFIEQVKLFANARTIIASSGAALANMVFCPPSTEIFIFISKHPDTSYWYWQNMAVASGKSVRYLLGDAKGNLGIHNDFSISLDEIVKALSVRRPS